MPPLPRKQAVALDLLERTSVFVHLDPRRPGVIVPQGFLKQPQLVLQIGLNMAIQIPDLDVSEEGISCTLSFNKRPQFCSLPWSSIYALIGEQGGGMVWPEDVPPEVVSQQRAAAKKEVKPRKPGLRAISGAGGDPADRSGDEAEATPKRRSEPPLRDAGPGTPRPPRLMQVVASPEAAEASGSDDAPQSEPPAQADVQRPESAPQREESVRPAAAKRSRPPYLRLVD